MNNLFSLTPRQRIVSLFFLTLISIILSLSLVSTHAQPNSSPVAVDDNYTLHSGGYTGPLMLNDYDPDGDELRFAGITTQPSHGTLEFDFGVINDHPFYHTNPGYVGPDSMTYQICDTSNACSSATVHITIINQAPVAVDDFYTIHRGGSIGLFTLNDYDPDTADSIASYQVITYPSHGRLERAEYSDPWYYPDTGFTGTDTLVYQICDSFGGCDTATVSITVYNHPPVAVDDRVKASPPYSGLGNVTSNDYDSDQDSFMNYRVVVPPSHGRLDPDPWYYPDPGYSGPDSYVYEICDFFNACGRATVFINDDDANAGAASCASVGGPVNVTNGNMYLQQIDYELQGAGEPLVVTRTYNSNSMHVNLFGRGWSTAYDESIRSFDISKLQLLLPDGRGVDFSRPQTSGPYNPVQGDFRGQIVTTADGGFTLTFKDGRVHRFDRNGKLISLTDLNNNQTTLTYSVEGKLVSVTDATGRVLSFASDSQGRIVSISDQMGTIANYAYGANNELLSVTYADNSKYQFFYNTINSNLLLTSVTDALGNVLEAHTYDSQGRALTSERDGGIERFTLNYVNNSETDVTDALGHVTKYFFDKSHGRNVVTRVEGACSCGNSQVQTWTYDNQLNVTSKTDALGHTTGFTYDSNGNRLTETDATGTATYTYNQLGEALTLTDQLNHVTANTYDANGNLTAITDPLNNTTAFTYNSRGQLLTITDARGKVTTFTYDSSGNLSQRKDANNITTLYFYDARSRMIRAQDPYGRLTLYAYDAAGRLNKITHPDNSFAASTYDLAGRRVSTTDERGNSTSYAYDNAYRLTGVTDALGHTATYAYDAMSNLTGMTDALARTTNYDYDEFNRVVKITYPPATAGAQRLFETVAYDAVGNTIQRTDTAGRATNYIYDNVNRVTGATDADNKTTHYEYDVLSRVTAVVDALGQRYEFAYDAVGRQTQITRGGISMSYVYDAVGNRTQRTDYNGTVTNYAYDNLNRLKTITYPTRTVTYTYTSVSQLSRATNENGSVFFSYDNRYRVLSVTDPFNYAVNYSYDAAGNRTKLSINGATYATYTYDAANRLTNLADSANQNFPHAYDEVNRLTSRTAPNGVVTSYAYDNLDRLMSLTHAAGATTLISNQYQYNDAGNITNWTNAAGNHAYSYDAVNRLTSAVNSVQTNENYSYDSVGNRTSSHQSASYQYQPFNKLTNTASASYTYDANGNLTSKADSTGTTVYSWNEENQLKQVSLPNGLVITYKYDALGRRIQRTTSAGANERYVYDGNDVLLDLNANFSITTSYLNDLGIDSHLRQTNSTTGVSYYLTDHLGSTEGLTDSSGNLIEQLAYDSFGNSSESSRTRYTYTGREWDSDAYLYYYRARFYDSQIGRFISEDPVEFDGGVNWYAYVAGNPINAVDPLGHDVLAVFYREKGVLRIEDQQTGRIIIIGNVFSGLPGVGEDQEGGPIPAGTYLIADGAIHGRHTWGDWFWYKLYRWDWPNPPSDDFYIRGRNGNRVRRNGLYLHTGTVSDGCVTVKSDVSKQHWGDYIFRYPHSQAYDIVKKALNETKPLSAEGGTWRGVLIVR